MYINSYVKVISKFVNKLTFRKDGIRYGGGSTIPYKKNRKLRFKKIQNRARKLGKHQFNVMPVIMAEERITSFLLKYHKYIFLSALQMLYYLPTLNES